MSSLEYVEEGKGAGSSKPEQKFFLPNLCILFYSGGKHILTNT